MPSLSGETTQSQKRLTGCSSKIGETHTSHSTLARGRPTDGNLLSQQQATPQACCKDEHPTPARLKNTRFSLSFVLAYFLHFLSKRESELLIELAEESCPSFRSLLGCPGGGRPSRPPLPSLVPFATYFSARLSVSWLSCVWLQHCLACATEIPDKAYGRGGENDARPRQFSRMYQDTPSTASCVSPPCKSSAARPVAPDCISGSASSGRPGQPDFPKAVRLR